MTYDEIRIFCKNKLFVERKHEKFKIALLKYCFAKNGVYIKDKMTQTPKITETELTSILKDIKSHKEAEAIRSIQRFSFKGNRGEPMNYVNVHKRIQPDGDNLLLFTMRHYCLSVALFLLSFANTNVNHINKKDYSILLCAVYLQRADLVSMITKHCSFNRRMIVEGTKVILTPIEQALKLPTSNILRILLREGKRGITESFKFELL